ncbi:MAG: sigma-54 interaction domain-containing protein, partial [Saezia sp.]
KVSQTNATVLITGESGTGKELVAKTIHYYSKRSTGPFIKVNCGALPETLLESTLFGHEKGAFTGAEKRQSGLFERANHGTLLLDELGEMSPNLQVKLLRVLQEKEFEPIGAHQTLRTDFRLIAATNKNLETLVADGRFRQDLFYRLNVMPIHMPPLRKRPEDIVLLAHYFVHKLCQENQREPMRLTEETIEALNRHAWPGNVRELSNAIEHAVVMSIGNLIYPDDLPEYIFKQANIKELAGKTNYLLKDVVKNYERDLIINALKAHNGHREQTAKALGISKRTLMYKIQEYDIED